MTIASGVSMGLAIKRETTWGVDPSPATGAQLLRRVSSDLGLDKSTYQSKEIRTDYQLSDMRHGTRKVTGSIKGELSAGTWQLFMESVCRAAFVAGATSGAIITVTAAAAAPHFVRSGGSWLTDGFKEGDIVRCTGWTTTGTANNSFNYRITALTALNMTVSDLNGVAGATGTVAAKAAGDSVTFTVVGKKVAIPASAHTNHSYTIEHRYTDITVYNRFNGCRIASMEVNLPATGMAEITTTFMGKDMVTAGSAFYSSPTAVSTSGVLAAVNGKVSAGGVEYGILTSLRFKIDGGMTTGEVIGSNTTPDVFPGRIVVTGQFGAYFQDMVLFNAFLNESNIDLNGAFADGSTATAEFVNFLMPKIKLGSFKLQDGEQGIMATMDFTALYQSAGGAGTVDDQTTLAIQDSLAV